MKEYSTYAKRTPLIEKLPLDTPMGVHICPSTYCNFKCHYCKHSLDTMSDYAVGQTGWLKRQFMDMELYNKIIDQLKQFPHKVKLLNFAWLGEPLLHPNIIDMVRIAKEADVADTVSIVTNASMLNKKMSDGLIDAGLDRLRISLQGLNADDYWDVAKYKIDYEEYLNNIKYFYEHKRSTDLYIKIIDAMLKTADDEARFRGLFEDICDYINIEHLVPIHQELDITDMKKEFDVGYFGNSIVENKICTYCFYMLVISPDGEIMPCTNADYIQEDGTIRIMGLGNIMNETITEYWNGDRLRNLRKSMIYGERAGNPICKACAYVKYHIAKEDRLDGYEEKLQELYCEK